MTKWPAPIVRLYPRVQLTPEAVLTAADTSDVKTKRGQVCEVNFYSGAVALQRGERKEAARLYGLAVSSCPEDFIERREANAELKALSADH